MCIRDSHYAVDHAQEGDLIAVIGKGHETYRDRQGVKTPFLERELLEAVSYTHLDVYKRQEWSNAQVSLNIKGLKHQLMESKIGRAHV